MMDMYLSPRDINVADFGLDGTDETDYTPAINAALSTCFQYRWRRPYC